MGASSHVRCLVEGASQVDAMKFRDFLVVRYQTTPDAALKDAPPGLRSMVVTSAMRSGSSVCQPDRQSDENRDC